MSFFGSNALKPISTMKRKEVRAVSQPTPVRPTAGKLAAPHPALSNGRQNGLPKSAPKPPSVEDRFKMTPAVKKKPVVKQKSSLARAGLKRKSETPQPTRLSSDSEGDDDDSFAAMEEERRRKRQRAAMASADPDRSIRDVEHWKVDSAPEELDIEHSVQMTTAPSAKGFAPIIGLDADVEVLLQYPSTTVPERFKLYEERGHDGYNSLDDLRRSMEMILQNYLPDSSERESLQSPDGISYHLSPTKKVKDITTIKNLITRYNNLISEGVKSGKIARVIDTWPLIPLTLIERIMSQTYVRTVSPYTDVLKKYTSGSDNTYGELQPAFCSQIFKETGLTSKKVFLDLGSGVGNIVIQAALETGAECHGVESVHDWSELGISQAKEFRARSRLWGLTPGSVNLVEADFLNCAALNDILPRVDVIIVNNYVFSPATNDSLKLLFLSLKEGAQVVSLKSFVSGELRDRNREDMGSIFEVRTKESYDGAVSWEADGVTYYIATKDSGRIERILGKRR